jgi:hypothetical protein
VTHDWLTQLPGAMQVSINPPFRLRQRLNHVQWRRAKKRNWKNTVGWDKHGDASVINGPWLAVLCMTLSLMIIYDLNY